MNQPQPRILSSHLALRKVIEDNIFIKDPAKFQ